MYHTRLSTAYPNAVAAAMPCRRGASLLSAIGTQYIVSLADQYSSYTILQQFTIFTESTERSICKHWLDKGVAYILMRTGTWV